MDLNSFDAAIFDMDGTIMDSLGIWERIDHDFLEKKRGIKVPHDYVHDIAAMSFSEIASYTKNRFNLPDTPQELMQEWTDMAIHEYSHNVFLKPFVKEYIKKLKQKGKKIVLCTSSPEYFFKPALKNNGIYHMFDAFANTCEAGVGKGSPKVYLLAAEKVGVDAKKCIVFEDVISAAASAKKAGMTVCGVYDERSDSRQDELRAVCHMYIRGFEELMEDK
ncbi:MAG: HAD family hydrolase [Clostridia bacterium]|nr:HAD family hydrolase [Clostridia bacterium]